MQHLLIDSQISSSQTEDAWHAFSEPLRAFLLKRVSDEQTAEDLLQEVFLKVHMQIGTLRAEEKIRPWMYQIARNTLIDFYRRQHSSTVPLEHAYEIAFEEEQDMRTDLAHAVTALIRCLSMSDQEALVLTEMEGLSQKDLATRLGLSFSGAKSRVQRARERLKQALLNCCHVEFDHLGRAIDYQSRCSCCQGKASSCEESSTSHSCSCVPNPDSPAAERENNSHCSQ